MNTYTVSPIIKNAPIPSKVRAPRQSSNPITQRLQKLNVNHSFVIEGADLKKIHPQVYATSKRLGIKVLTRSVEGGVQVWRVPDRATKTAARKAA